MIERFSVVDSSIEIDKRTLNHLHQIISLNLHGYIYFQTGGGKYTLSEEIKSSTFVCIRCDLRGVSPEDMTRLHLIYTEVKKNDLFSLVLKRAISFDKIEKGVIISNFQTLSGDSLYLCIWNEILIEYFLVTKLINTL